MFQDFAAATAVRVNPDGSQTQLPVTTCYLLDCEMNPIDVSSGTVYLSLYGTGFAQALAEYTSCTVAGKAVEVTYAGPEMAIAGLDQLNLLLPASLAGSGVSTVACLVGFSQSTFFTAAVTSNPVKVTIR